MRRFGLALLLALQLVLFAGPVRAGPVVAAIGTWFAAQSIVVQIIGRILISVAASSLMQALAPKPKLPGIRTEVTQNGGTNPCAFVLLTYATAGQRVCPPMSHGNSNKLLTEVIELGDIPGQALVRVMINDQYVTLGTTPDPDYGLPVLGELDGEAWVIYYDGTQTVADPMLLDKYSAYPERPWSSDMIGLGLNYAILTCRFNRKKWNAMPRFRFEVVGIPLYDPRKDTTVGGSGSHLWADPSTWEPSTNAMVATYNVLRGIELMDGSVWGGGFPAEDLPLAPWFAAMNECDMAVNDGDGGTEPQYRAGYEVSVDMEPADVIAELLKACSGQLTEVGGTWIPRVGGPGLPVLSITDADVITTSARDLNPFPGFTSSYNGIHASYPEPEMLWAAKEAPPLYNATWEAEDQDQRLIADVGLPTVPYGAQVRRLMEAYIAEERRFRRHGLTLPPDAVILQPLDAISWTSAANGYTSKVFEVAEVVDDLMTGLQTVALRERDADDYVSSDPAPPPVPSVTVVPPETAEVTGFAVSGTSITDAASTARRPALLLEWDPADMDDVRGIFWEVRVDATGVVVASGTSQNVAAGEIMVSEGILASTDYEARAQAVVDRPANWTAWTPATTPDTLITGPDIAVGAVSETIYSEAMETPELFSALPLNTSMIGLTVDEPELFWTITVNFDVSRTAASGGTFTVVLEEIQFAGFMGGIYRVLHTWDIMPDDNSPVYNEGPGNVWGTRWHAVIRGGRFTSLGYRLRVSANSGSPTGRLRRLRLAATRVLK
jgi:hypothetical protein